MSGHTKGPWRWLNTHLLSGDHGRRPVVLLGKQFRHRGEDGLLKKFDPDSPDGRLIEAAPDLLEALKLAEKAMNYMGDKLNDMDLCEPEDEEAVTPAFEAVRAAIAKAERTRTARGLTRS